MKTVKMMRRVLVILIVLVMCQSVLGLNYQIVDLGTLGGNESKATDINENGVVVGWAQTASGETHAFKYDNDVMTDIGTLGGTMSEAYGINDYNDIVGRSENGSGQIHAFLFDNNTMTDLGTLGGAESLGEGINNSGQIVCSSQISTGYWRAAIYENGQMTNLGTLGGTSWHSLAHDINESGQIVGYSDVTGGSPWHACMWDNSTIYDLGTLSGTSKSHGQGINDNGEMTGYSNNHPSPPCLGFIYESGSMSGIGSLGYSPDDTRGRSINNSRQIVGYSRTVDGIKHAFFYDGSNMIDLGTLGGDESEALCISDNGIIVGWAETAGGQQHAVMWILDLTTYHVDGATGSDSNDGLSRETAFETIQHAIDTAVDGDTVLVWPGVYNETATHGINFGGKAITVKSASDAAVLEVPGFTAATFALGENENSVLSNFVIKGSTTGIFALFADPTIDHVTVVDNTNGLIADNAAPVITNSIFANNTNGDLFDCTAQYSFVEDEINDGLVAYWKLDGDVTDSAGTNDGTLVNGPVWTNGIVGEALQLDGTNDYVDLGTSFASVTASTTKSIMLWANSDDGLAANMMTLYRKSDSSSGFKITAGDDPVVWRGFYMTGANTWQTLSSEVAVSIGKWVHLALIQDGANINFYINGELAVSANDGAAPAMSNPINASIGAYIYGGPSSCFNGTVDDARIYNRALTADEIEAMYEVGLAGHAYGEPGFADPNSGDYHLLSERGRYRPSTDEWILDDVTSSCVDAGDPNVEPTGEPMPNGGHINMGAYGNTATASMSEWALEPDFDYDGGVGPNDVGILSDDWLEQLTFSQEPTGSALQFDGVDDYVEIDNSFTSVSGNTTKTIMGWAKSDMTNYPTSGRILTIYKEDGTTSFMISAAGEPATWQGLYRKSGDTHAYLYSGIAVVSDQWTHVTLVQDGANISLYVNGMLVDSASDAGIPNIISPPNSTIGAFVWSGGLLHPFKGVLDEIAIYNRALSASEIEDIYHCGVIADSNLVGYWGFQECSGQVAADSSGNGNDGQLGSASDTDTSDPVWTASEVPGITYHVDGLTGDNGNDGLTQATAFATIQKAVSEAQDCDTVLVWPGVYDGPVYIVDKAITIKSADEPAVIDGGYDDATAFYSWQGKQATLKNFIIQNGFAGAYVDSGSPVLENLTIVDCYTGIEAETGADPNINSCILANNDYDLWNCTTQHSFVEEDINDGLVAYWKLDGDATDSAGTNDGTIYGAVSTTGQVGDALDFDGVDDYVAVADAPGLNPKKITIAAWIYPEDVSHRFQIVGKWRMYNDPDEYIFDNNVDNDRLRFLTFLNGTQLVEVFSNDAVLMANTWQHVAITWSGTTFTFYVNGVNAGENSDYSGDLPDSDNQIYIGRNYDWGTGGPRPLDGKMDDVRIYNRALSSEEIQTIYEAGLGGQAYGEAGFADAASGDYRLLSKRGRYRLSTGEWVLDGVTSPCVDGGDPYASLSNERMPNGGRVNMGAYGGTTQASMSQWPLIGDLNLDGTVNLVDYAGFALQWLEKEEWKL